MKMKTLAAIALTGLCAASITYAAPAMNDDTMGEMQSSSPTQLADNGMGSNGNMSGTSSMNSMSGTNNIGAMSDSSGMSGSSNMSGTNNMSGTSTMSGVSGLSGTSTPSDEGGTDTATGDDY
jgi:hypothetical protein